MMKLSCNLLLLLLSSIANDAFFDYRLKTDENKFDY